MGFEVDMVVDSVGSGGGANTEWEGRAVGDGGVGVRGKARAADS